MKRSVYILVIMCRKNSDPLHVIFSQSLWLQCALLCLPGSLELGCSWTAHQCKSPHVINLAKSKISIFSGNYLVKTLNCHISSTVRAFDLIPKLRARPKYQLSSHHQMCRVWLTTMNLSSRNRLGPSRLVQELTVGCYIG